MTRYRHSYHAGNFADVHKHVTLTALIDALARKDKGFLYLETHAGRGAYDLNASAESRSAAPALERVLARPTHVEIATYARRITRWRERAHRPSGYPGSPLLAASALRPQDRMVVVELVASEASALERGLAGRARTQVVQGDGFEQLRAFLPPIERRGLTLIDPPYESPAEATRAREAIVQGLKRFPTGVIALWYPLKHERDAAHFLAQLRDALAHELLLSELWLHPCDSRVGLNGSGVAIVNAPYGIAERMREWLPALHSALSGDGAGGARVRFL